MGLDCLRPASRVAAAEAEAPRPLTGSSGTAFRLNKIEHRARDRIAQGDHEERDGRLNQDDNEQENGGDDRLEVPRPKKAISLVLL